MQLPQQITHTNSTLEVGVGGLNSALQLLLQITHTSHWLEVGEGLKI